MKVAATLWGSPEGLGVGLAPQFRLWHVLSRCLKRLKRSRVTGCSSAHVAGRSPSPRGVSRLQ